MQGAACRALPTREARRLGPLFQPRAAREGKQDGSSARGDSNEAQRIVTLYIRNMDCSKAEDCVSVGARRRTTRDSGSFGGRCGCDRNAGAGMGQGACEAALTPDAWV